MADVIRNSQRAAAGFEAIIAYVQASDPDLVQDRLVRLLCDLRHYAHRTNGLGFAEVLERAREDHERQQAGVASLARDMAAARAVDGHKLHAPQRDGERDAAVEKASAGLSPALISDLWHYADTHGADFTEVLAMSERSYTEQRLQEEGPFLAGCHTISRALPSPSPAVPSFQPAATSQGVVTSVGDAEWLLVRTAARLQELEQRGHTALALPSDISDRRVLSEALGAACELTGPEVLRRLEPWIRERVESIRSGVADAAAMGHEHGVTGIEPYCRLDMDGHDSRLMDAFGETEPTTDANALHRLALIRAYTTAYARARKQAGAAPAELAERDFPQGPGAPPPHDGSLPSAGSAGVISRAEPRPRQNGP
jgi:hypothetical protein